MPAIARLSIRANGIADPVHADARGHSGHRLNHALQHIDALADGDQQRQRRRDVERAGEHAAPCNGAGKSAGGVLNFVAHHRSEFETDQTEADHAEGIENEARVGGNLEIGGGDAAAEARPDHDAEADEHCWRR